MNITAEHFTAVKHSVSYFSFIFYGKTKRREVADVIHRNKILNVTVSAWDTSVVTRAVCIEIKKNRAADIIYNSNSVWLYFRWLSVVSHIMTAKNAQFLSTGQV